MSDDATSLELGPGAINIAGQRFGELVALHIVRKSACGNRWLFACDCGGFAERTVAAVRKVVRQGGVPQCASCLAEQNRGRWISINQETRSRYADLYARTGRLWSWASEERLARDVAEALDKEGWDPPEEPMTLPIACYSLLDAIVMAEKASASKRVISPEVLEERRERVRVTRRQKKLQAELETQAEMAELRERSRAGIAADIARFHANWGQR